jgi:hypothetical protein
LPTPVATAAPFTVKPLLLDNGTEINPATPAPKGTPVPPFVYKEIQSVGPESSETQSPLNSTTDPLPSGAPASAPTNPAEPVAGSHLVTFSGSGSQNVTLQFSKTLPDLVYQHNSGIPGQTAGFFTYSTLVFHLALLPGTVAPLGTLTNVAADITGSETGVGAFDVRVQCTGLPGAAPAFEKIVCPKIPALGSSSNTSGPNPVIPGAGAAFDPVAAFSPKLSIVLYFSGITDTASVGNELYIDNVYVTQ